MDNLIVFGAKYLIILSPLIALWVFYKASREMRKEMIMLGTITLPIAYVLGIIVRHFYFDPRPFVVKNITPLIAHAPDNGFPSDHMLLLASIAAVVTYFDRKAGIVLWVIALLVGASRVLANVHHIIDILGSVVIALLSAWFAHAIIHKLWNRNNQTNS